jgi:tripartite-type tricarboxylate transporter receptor subunit TctC
MIPLRIIACVLSACLGVAAAAPASAADDISFRGKTVTMLIPSTAGAGTDLSARLFARYFTKHLPGQPTFVSTNIPAGHGVTALNFLANQSKPDGLTIVMASDSQVDPLVFRVPQARYDPLKLPIVGAVATSDTVLIARADALPRLTDASAKPVIMGSVGGTPRASMRMAVWGSEYLRWHVQWVVGYPGSSDLALALDRGEIDMTTFPGAYLSDKLTDTAKYKILYRSGFDGSPSQSGRADIDSAPAFTEAMNGKISDPDVVAAFAYWRAQTLFKWLALPPGTPDAIVKVYRDAYVRIGDDPEFRKNAVQIADSFAVLPPDKAAEMVYALAGTSDKAIETMAALMSKQGIKAATGE